MSRGRVSRSALVALALVAATLPARAADDAAGTTVGSFLSVGAGASVLSMGGATIASGRDLAAAAWNPASLSRLDALEFSLSHAPLPGGASQEWASVGGRLRGGDTRWGLNALFHSEGSIDGRDASNNPTGSLSVSDLAFGARVAHPIGPMFSAGLGAQWVHESLAGTNGSGFAFDAGLRGQSGPVGFGIAARNLGSGLNYGGTSYDLPGVVAAGVSWSDEGRGLHVNADFESPSHYYRDMRVGGEWRWRERVALRAGYRYTMGVPSGEQLSGAAFGLGAGVGGMWMDYAFSPDGDQSTGQHRIGLTFRPGMMGHAGSEPQTRKITPAPEPAAPRPRTVREPSRPVLRTPEQSAPVVKTPVVTAPTPTPPPAAAPTPTPAVTRVFTPPVVTAKPAPPQATPTSVVVVEGETMATIARRWGTTPAAIMMTNNMVSENVRPGMRLKLPPGATKR